MHPPFRPRIAVFFDSPDENWRAMDLVGEMLVREWKGELCGRVRATPFSIDLPRLGRRYGSTSQFAFNLDRAVGRFAVYPAYAARQRSSFDCFHIVDHTYAQLVHVLRPARTGVYCHDLDAFRSLLPGTGDRRTPWFRAIQRVTLRGMQAAGVVFYSTAAVRDEIVRTGLIAEEKLVHAPYGISPEFDATDRSDDEAARYLAPLEGRPFLLHVGSAATRKRLDVLFETFGKLRERHPELRLVQHGAALSEGQRALVRRAGIEGVFVQPAASARIDRSVLAGFYRRARAVLVTSSAEGFGMPVIEALACGTPVFASDIGVLREVGKEAAIYCRVGDPDAWAATLHSFLQGELAPPPRELRLAQAAKYTWRNYAQTILDSYCALGE
jgi:glycosyltransferase involved in cell wall biosynthesis